MRIAGKPHPTSTVFSVLLKPLVKPAALGLAAFGVLIGCNLARTAPTATFSPPTDVPANQPIVTPLPGAPTLAGVGDPVEAGCPPPPPGWLLYVIQDGDSIGGLAAAVGLSVDELTGSNCIANPDEIFSGQEIYLPIYPDGFNPNPTANAPVISG